MIEIVEDKLRKKDLTSREYASMIGETEQNWKPKLRRFSSKLKVINSWLEKIGLELKLGEK